MVKTVSLFTQQQITLQAAQKTFTQVSGLSLFNYIN
jgi:flagellar hook-associated protein 3 FlgL